MAERPASQYRLGPPCASAEANPRLWESDSSVPRGWWTASRRGRTATRRLSAMSSIAAAPSRRVLADVIARPSSRARAFALDAGLVISGAAVVALLAQAEVPLWPVPITGQTLGVIVVGATLGAWRGAAALATYMMVGLAGLPVFAGFTGTVAAIAKPSFGFVIGFIFAAFVAGWFAQRAWDRRPALAFLGFAAASVVPFVFGIPYMAFILNVVLGLDYTFAAILEVGLLPFILGGVIKAGVAAAIIPAAWSLVRKADATKN
jgi:biotin transport system substrate-specific component